MESVVYLSLAESTCWRCNYLIFAGYFEPEWFIFWCQRKFLLASKNRVEWSSRWVIWRVGHSLLLQKSQMGEPKRNWHLYQSAIHIELYNIIRVTNRYDGIIPYKWHTELILNLILRTEHTTFLKLCRDQTPKYKSEWQTNGHNLTPSLKTYMVCTLLLILIIFLSVISITYWGEIISFNKVHFFGESSCSIKCASNLKFC